MLVPTRQMPDIQCGDFVEILDLRSDNPLTHERVETTCGYVTEISYQKEGLIYYGFQCVGGIPDHKVNILAPYIYLAQWERNGKSLLTDEFIDAPMAVQKDNFWVKITRVIVSFFRTIFIHKR